MKVEKKYFYLYKSEISPGFQKSHLENQRSAGSMTFCRYRKIVHFLGAKSGWVRFSLVGLLNCSTGLCLDSNLDMCASVSDDGPSSFGDSKGILINSAPQTMGQRPPCCCENSVKTENFRISMSFRY